MQSVTQPDPCTVLQACGLSAQAYQVLEGNVFRHRWHPPSDVALPLLIRKIEADDGPWIQDCLLQAYPAAHGVHWHDPGKANNLSVLPLSEWFWDRAASPAACLVVPPLESNRSVHELANILARLRAPGGCPWDQEQTLASVRNALLSEAYEVVEAIDLQDDDNLQEELGDLIMDALFLVHIAMTEGKFQLADVMAAVCEKMIRRHPHVFGDTPLPDSESVLSQWDQIKQAEKRAKNQTLQPLDGIPRTLPALEAARELQKKAKKAQLAFPAALAAPAADATKPLTESELGTKLWHLVARAADQGLNAEGALRRINVLFRQQIRVPSTE